MADLHASELRRVVDQQCDAFEEVWSGGDRPAIGDFLGAVPEEGRGNLLGELLALELELRVRAGETPEIDAYKDQYAENEKHIEQAFDEFQAWAESTDLIDEELRPCVVQSDQDTQAQALDTKEWSLEVREASDSQLPSLDTLDENIPRQIGRYEVLRKLGQGGMGTVLLAHDPALDRNVALKLPHFDTRKDAQAIERFYREARSMATVHHPNLCPIYDVGEHDDRPYLTMAYIDGQSLAEGIDSAGAMELAAAVHLVRKLALAIQTAHEAGVLHRDLKPANVMIDEKGEPFITDFGLASRDRQTEAELTQSGTLIGSPAYMAPEQVDGPRQSVGPHTDVYALGVILYQLLCGRRPFEGSGPAVLGQIASGKRPPPPSQLANVDKQLEAICLGAMAHDVNKRFRSAQDLADSLDVWLKVSSGGPVAARSGKQASAIATGVALLLLGGWTAYMLTFGSSPQSPDGEIAAVDLTTETEQAEFVGISPPPIDPLAPPLAAAPFDEDAARQHQQAWSDYLKVPIKREISLHDGVRLTLVLIPPGEFVMGSTEAEQTRFVEEVKTANDAKASLNMRLEMPQFPVRISRPFYLGKYEVTQAQWQAVMESSPARGTDSPNCPVRMISWDEIETFLTKLNADPAVEKSRFSLPTEAQWEYACRAGTTSPWHSGETEAALRESAWFASYSGGTTQEVGQLSPNGFGLYDMHGNVWEWCADWFSPYSDATSPVLDRSGPPAGRYRVYRGGSQGHPAWQCRSGIRIRSMPSYRGSTLGFRLVMSVDPTIRAK